MAKSNPKQKTFKSSISVIVIKLILILNFLGVIFRIIERVQASFLLQMIPLTLSFLFFILMWRTINKVYQNTANPILHWLLYYSLSITAVMIGVWVMFVIRFFLDIALIRPGQPLHPIFSFITSYGGFIISLFPLHLLAKMIRMPQPWRATIILLVIWVLIITLINIVL